MTQQQRAREVHAQPIENAYSARAAAAAGGSTSFPQATASARLTLTTAYLHQQQRLRCVCEDAATGRSVREGSWASVSG